MSSHTTTVTMWLQPDLPDKPLAINAPDAMPDIGTSTPPIFDMDAYEAQIILYLPLLTK